MNCKRIDALSAAEFLKTNDNFLILTHMNPDGDTLGSGFALNAVLRSIGKNSKVRCSDETPSKFQFLVPEREPEFNEETVIAVDVADERLLGGLKDVYAGKIDLCIDHHGTNMGYAKNLYLEGESASCCECVYEVVKALGAQVTPFVASALYLGMATDTGCFKFSNTTPRTHRFAAELMELGASYDEINRSMFETKSKSRVEMEKMVLENIEFWFDGRCAVITVLKSMIEATGCEQTDLDGITALSRQIEGVLIGITLKEKYDNFFKVSIRTFEPFDAAEIAMNFGGGGHKRAAGCEFTGTADEIKAILKSLLQEKVF